MVTFLPHYVNADVFQTPEVVAAIVGGGSAVVGTLIAAIAAALIGRKFTNSKKLNAELAIAQRDIIFLLEVERRHCEMHRVGTGRSNKYRVRSQVLRETNLTWSRRFTRSRIRSNSDVL
jgi:hypothetical protein